MNKIRVGMIGAGAIALNHCDGVVKHPAGEVVAVADLSAERAKEVADKYGIAGNRIYTKWEQLIADKDIDAVAIALPNFLHAPVSMAALKAGKHVILDKPFATCYEDAKKVAALAKSKRKVFMVGMNQRYSNEAQTIKAIVGRGELGDIYHAKAYWMRRSGCPKFGTWFGQKKLAGGGCLYDIGVHVLDLCMFLVDNWQPVAVSGQVYTKFGNRGLGEGGWGKSDKDKRLTFDVDDFGFALVKFKNGASIELNVSWALHQESPNRHGVELFGTEGGANVFPKPKIFRYNKKQKGEYEIVEPQNVKIAQPECNRHVDWLNTILGKGKPMCTVEQALVVQKILDAVYKSSGSGREVRIK